MGPAVLRYVRACCRRTQDMRLVIDNATAVSSGVMRMLGPLHWQLLPLAKGRRRY